MIERRLGKLPPRHDVRTYRLSPVLAARVPDVPEHQDWSQGVPYQMWGNDQFGCCAFAAHAALTATWTKVAQGLVLLSSEQVLQNYGAVTGFNPVTGQNDNGTILLEQLQYWKSIGFVRPGQTRDYLTAYGIIDSHSVSGIKRGISYLGGVLAGVQVPRGFMSLPLGTDWDWDAVQDHVFVGGHAIALTGYTLDGVFFNTWGSRTFMPWNTFLKICDEAYGLVSRQNWLTVQGLSPKSEDVQALVAEMSAA